MNKELVKKIILTGNITQAELVEFIIDHCKLCGKREPTAQEMPLLVQAAAHGMIDLMYAARIAAVKLDLGLIEILDRNQKVINKFFND